MGKAFTSDEMKIRGLGYSEHVTKALLSTLRNTLHEEDTVRRSEIMNAVLGLMPHLKGHTTEDITPQALPLPGSLQTDTARGLIVDWSKDTIESLEDLAKQIADAERLDIEL